MKKFFLSLIVSCAAMMVSCGNAEVDKINQLVVEATALTAEATSLDEIVEIATNLQTEMETITATAGDKISIGKSVDEALTKYQEVAEAKLAEFFNEL